MSIETGAGKQRRNQFAFFWIVAALVTAFCAFVLPFFFPRNQPVLSASYTAGDNNRVAAVAVAGVMVAVLFVCWWWRIGVSREDKDASLEPGEALETNSALGRRWLGWAILAAVLFTAVLGGLVLRAHIFWGDEGYFLNRLRTGLILHRPIYTGFEFSYGPLLYKWPLTFVRALMPLGLSMSAAYLVSLAAIQVLGLALLFYVLQALPMRRGLKATLFALLTLGFLTPLLGINYSVFRFILPFAGVVWLSRQTQVGAAALVAVVAEMVELGCSPEMGMAFGAAVAIYGLYRALTAGKRWLWVSGVAILCTFVGRGSLLTMAKFANGEFNLIVEPLPHMLVFLVAAVALAPLAVATALRTANDDQTHRDQAGRDAGMLLGIFVASVGLLPVALGRCDPIHVLFNGVGLYLLSFVAIDKASPRWRTAWIVVFAGVVLLTQAVNFGVYKGNFNAVLRRTPARGDEGIDLGRLEAAVGSGGIAIPIYAPQTVVDDLTRSGQIRPGYFSGLGWDAAAEQRTIDDMRQAEFALVPTQTVLFTEDMDNTRIKRILRLGYIYRQRRPPFVVGLMIERELAEHWKAVGRFGSYTLYRRIS